MSKENTPRTPKTNKPRTSKKASATVAASATEARTVAKPTLADLDAEIRRRAYELYLQREGMPGDPHQDWLVAEQEIRSRHVSQGD